MTQIFVKYVHILSVVDKNLVSNSQWWLAQLIRKELTHPARSRVRHLLASVRALRHALTEP